MKVYMVNCSDSDIEFRELERTMEYDVIKNEAKRLGTVYTLEEFQNGCNDEEIDITNSFMLID